jgi:type I restriction enzyme, R subunit
VVNDVPVWVVAERVQYHGDDGKLITESLKDYSRKAVLCEYASLDEFLTRSNAAKQKKAIIDQLEGQGVLEALLDKYADEGLAPLEAIGVLRVQPLNHFGTPLEIVKLFGNRDKFLEAIRELKAGLYEAAA